MICCLFYATFSISQGSLTDYVNPFIGTGGHGHTYPGAVVPFGMVQLSPDTRTNKDDWDGCSGYHYSDSVVYGFSHTHLSGTGCSDFCDILFMPTTGEINFNNGSDGKAGYSTSFKKKNEAAKAGYYQLLMDNGINVELTSTQRTGIHRYIYPKSNKSNVIIDLEHRDDVIESSIKIVNDHEVEGMRRSKAWAKDQFVYFVAEFSKPFKSHIIHTKDKGDYNAINELNWKNIKAALLFGSVDTIVVTVGISSVSVDGARKNLKAEVKDFNFDHYHQEATNAWEKELSKIVIKSKDKDKKTIFYTALYHTMICPNLYSDVDGNYRGMDLKIHHSDHNVYNVFSLWDTYRAAHPLYTIIEQKRTNDFINTFLKCYDESGRLPVWELAANETDCMIGYHSIAVIVDAYQKGIKGFDAEKTLRAMIKTSNETHFGLGAYVKDGYIPSDSCGESVSRTLEYAYDDWCIAQFVKLMGNKTYYDSYYKPYMERAQYWKNIFDSKSNFFRAKKNGSFKEPFDPFEVNFDLTEANTWQYNFAVPQDISGLMKAMGGKDKFMAKLDEMFTAQSKTSGREQPDIAGMIGQYAHGNEPSHHMAYLYDYAGQPWKTQERVHQIMTTLYKNDPDGLCGNEDCGQMSAWYALSAMGFYPVCPGSGQYAIGTPLFDEVTINLENGGKFIVSAKNLSNENYYVQSMGINYPTWPNNMISHEAIMNGSQELGFIMGNKPNLGWGSWDGDDGNVIKTSIDTLLITPVPTIESISKTFTDSAVLKFACIDSTAKIIVYTFDKDGHAIELMDNTYTKPIVLKESGKVEAFAVKGINNVSKVVTSNFIKIPKGRTIQLLSKYSPQYSAGGDNALIDYIRGNSDFHTGEWQGYEGTDFDAVVDLGEMKYITEVGLGCLQDIGSWIFMPTEITISVSKDGVVYEKPHTMKTDDDLADPVRTPTNRTYSLGFEYPFISEKDRTGEYRFVKIHAKNYGILPKWHLGAGGKAWIFLDEIIIK